MALQKEKFTHVLDTSSFWRRTNNNYGGKPRPTATGNVQAIDQFRRIKIQPKTIDLSARLWEITTEFVGFIP